MTQRLQCLICLDALPLSESAALRCGHIFHLHCILQWLESCKTCPVCRKKATTKDLIRQLFFQMEENKSFNSDSTDPLEMHNQLQNALDNLEKERLATAEAKNEANAYLAANLLLKEKVANLESVSRLNVQQIKHLEGMLEKQLDTEKELQKYKKRLQASAFYRLLSSIKDEPVLEIDKYIANEGLEMKKFIALLRRQLKDVMKTIESQKEELQESRKKISELQKKLNEHKDLNIALEKEVALARADSSQTIMNGTVEKVTAFSPKQHSFSPVDVDDCKIFSASLTASACKTSGNSALVQKIQGTTPIRNNLEISVFRDEAESLMGKIWKNELQADIENDMEEVFVPPVIRKCATTTQFHSTSRKTVAVKHNQVIRNRESLKKRSSYVQHCKKREPRCSRYCI
ncbi:Ring finger domain family protein [Acanthocheilonema viteae]